MRWIDRQAKPDESDNRQAAAPEWESGIDRQSSLSESEIDRQRA